MEDSLETGNVRSISQDDFKKALREVKPSTRPWFEIAKNYALFANEGGDHDDLLEHLGELQDDLMEREEIRRKFLLNNCSWPIGSWKWTHGGGALY